MFYTCPDDPDYAVVSAFHLRLTNNEFHVKNNEDDLAGARAMILLELFQSEMRRQSAPLMKTPARSCGDTPRFSPLESKVLKVSQVLTSGK